MSKSNLTFALVAVVALVLSCVSIHCSLSQLEGGDVQGIGTRLEILNHWVDGELSEFAAGREFNSLEFSYVLEVARIGWVAARLLREHQYDAADSMLVHSSYVIDDYIDLRYGEGGP